MQCAQDMTYACTELCNQRHSHHLVAVRELCYLQAIHNSNSKSVDGVRSSQFTTEANVELCVQILCKVYNSKLRQSVILILIWHGLQTCLSIKESHFFIIKLKPGLKSKFASAHYALLNSRCFESRVTEHCNCNKSWEKI